MNATPSITFVPVGGLANRMRSIAASVALAQACHASLRIYWFKDFGLNCDFHQLFKPLAMEEVTLSEATKLDLLLYDRPRRKNFFLPALWQSIAFDRRLYEDDKRLDTDTPFNLCQWVGNGNCFMASYNRFYTYPKELCRQLFRPVAEIEEQLEEVTRQFTPHTVGIHIRRTDHTQAIAASPLALFIEEMERMIAADEQANFYVATDSPAVKAELKDQFGARILTYECELSRNSLAGMRAGAVELWALSHTSQIVGSFFSSYTEMAAELGAIPYRTISKQPQKQP